MRNIANMYAGGYGVPFDQALAESWYEKAARMGDPVSIKRMAALRPSGEFAAAARAAPVAEAAPVEPTPAAEPMTVAGDDQAAEAVPAPVEPSPETVAEPVAESAPEPVAPEATAEPASESNAAPTESPAQSDPDLQYGDTGSPTPAATATPAATQQAAVTPPPASDPGNWLIGMWQGPSLGCPPNGGLEFLPGETRSYYGGQIAARLQAKYEVAGDHVKVTSTGIDGVGSSYEYERRGPDTFVITAVPADMPSSMIGAEHRRCAGAPLAAAAAPAPAAKAAAPAPAPAPVPQAAALASESAAPAPKPFVPQEPVAETQPAPVAAPAEPAAEAPQVTPIVGALQATVPPAVAPQSAPAGSPLEAGWDAFGRGDYAGALAIWQPLAEQGDVNMQLLIGSIYDLGQGVPQDDAEAVKWYERAAAQGSAKGQYQLGAVYARSAQVKDPFQGYKWLTIAANTLASGPQGGVTADQATTLRTLIEGELNKDQIAKARAEAKAFKPSKG
jgi:TPR repeat protein